MLDNTNLAEPFDVSTFEEALSSPVIGRSEDFAPPSIRRSISRLDRRLTEPRLEDNSKMAEPTGATDAGEVAHDPVNHPRHYTTHPSGIECIQVTRWMSFNLGNAVKYIWRCNDKGATIEDLKKARWYIDDEIARLEKLVS